jgi:hypothetical protein
MLDLLYGVASEPPAPQHRNDQPVQVNMTGRRDKTQALVDIHGPFAKQFFHICVRRKMTGPTNDSS